MSIFDEDAYIKKCPICGEKLEVDEQSFCNNCHLYFEFFIRYHHLWKYTKTNLVQIGDKYYCDEKTTTTFYVYEGNK